MQSPSSVKDTEDPDYRPTNEENRRENVSQSLIQQDAKEQTVQKIRSIIREQFSLETHLKEREIELIDQRISQTRAMLDRLRACVLARYYGRSERAKQGKDFEVSGKRSTKRQSVEAPSGLSASANANANTNTNRDTNTGTVTNTNAKTNTNSTNSQHFNTHPRLSPTPINVDSDVSRLPVALNAGNTVSGESTPDDNSTPARVKGALLQGENDSACAGNSQHSTGVRGTEANQRATKPGNSTASPAAALPSSEKSESSVAGIKHEGENTESNEQSPHIPGNCPSVECLLKAHVPDTSLTHVGSRFYVKKRIIVGNTSKYVPLEGREANDKSSHKWMVYVRGPPEDPHIDRFIKKVWFFLHPSYRPNDIVEVNKPPFHLTRRGWGEFPIRAQLHFVDSRNKRVDIIHELKLDRTYTGLQTLGAETLVDLELDRKTFEDLGIPYELSPAGSFSMLTSSTSINTSESKLTRDAAVENMLRESAGVKRQKPSHSSSADSVSQIPQLKKLKLEESTYSISSTFSSLASTPINSLPSSRCTSPETLPVSIHKFSDRTEEALHRSAKIHPLVHPERDLVRFPYCARSVDQFRGWNIGKRRAAEWQRALAVKRNVQKDVGSRDLSTKDVIFWCRRYGYTPFEKPSVSENCCYCKVCGLLVEPETDVETDELAFHKECIEAGDFTFSTLSSSADFLVSTEEKEKSLPDLAQSSDDEEDSEVDVVGYSPRGKPLSQKPEGQICSLSLAPEEEWVREVCNDIGIQLQPVNFDGVRTHAVERMLWSAGKKFAEDILRHALASAADRPSSSGYRVVVPGHVHRAVSILPACDFLGKSYLGVLVTEEDE